MTSDTNFATWLEGRVSRDTLLKDARAALAAVDLNGTVRLWNPYSEVLFGWAADEALGRHISELTLLPGVAGEPAEWLARLERGETWEVDLPLRHKDGSRLWVHLTASPVRDEDDNIVGGVAVAFDITDRRRAEERLSLQFDVSRTLEQAETLQGAIQQLLPTLCTTLGWSYGDFWTVDPSHPRLHCIETWSKPGTDTRRFVELTMDTTFVYGEGLPGRVWAEKKPVWITDVVLDPHFPRARMAAEVGLHSALAFPFFGREHFFGVIEFFGEEPLAPDQELLDLFAAMGAQLGQFVDRLRAEEETKSVQARRGAILASAFDCIVSMDAHGRVVEFNPAAEETFGYTRDEAVGSQMSDLIIPPELRQAHKDGLERYLTTGEARVLGQRIEITAMRKGGETFPVELAITPVEMTGDVLFTGSIRDITERKRVEAEIADLLDRERLAREAAERSGKDLYDLQRITDVALAHLNLEGLLDELLDRLTEIFQCDALGILIATDDGQALNLRAQRGLEVGVGINIPIGEGIAGSIAHADSAILIPDVQDQSAYTPFFELGEIRSIIGVPMHQEGELLGVVMAGSNVPGTFGDREIRLLTLAAQRIATGISNAAEYSREHRIADTLQRSLLPQTLPIIPEATLIVRYLPGGPGTMVGGDWYDAVPLPEGRVGITLGDVTGKGVRAASLMGQMRSALYSYALIGHSPSEVMNNLDRMVQSTGPESFATVVYMDFDPEAKIIRMSNAGHPPPALRAPDGTVSFIEGEIAPPIGVVPDPQHTEMSFEAEPGSVLVMYSDGLIEKPGGDIDEGLRLLAEALSSADPSEAEDLCDHILDVVFARREPSDDVAIAAIRFD